MKVDPLRTKVGIIAPGTIGAALAVLLAICGFRDVKLMSYSADSVKKGFRKNGIGSLLKLVSKGVFAPLTVLLAQRRVQLVVGLEALMDREILIECGPEGKDGWKTQLYGQLRDLLGARASQVFLFTTTSSNDVDELSLHAPFASNFGGLHVINDVLTCRLTELFICRHATEETNDVMRQLGKLLGKITVELPGCLKGGYLNDTAFTAAARGFERAQQVVDLWPHYPLAKALQDQHTAMTLGCNWPLGAAPFCHFVGWDTSFDIFGNQGNFQHPEIAAAIGRGELGRKTGSPTYLTA